MAKTQYRHFFIKFVVKTYIYIRFFNVFYTIFYFFSNKDAVIVFALGVKINAYYFAISAAVHADHTEVQ